MADFNALGWTALYESRKAKPRDFNADAAEAVGTQEALRAGQRPDVAMIQGMQSRQTMLDPLAELRRAKLQTEIRGAAQQFQEGILSQKIKAKQIDDEAEDTLAASQLPNLPDDDKRLEFLNTHFWKSARGIANATQWRQQISLRKQKDWLSRSMATISQKDPALAMRLSTMDPSSPEFFDELRKFGELNKPQSPFGKLQADLDAELSGQNRPEVVKRFMSAIELASSNKGKSIYMGMDDSGKPIFQMTEGGSSPIGTPTVSTQSLTQQKLLRYEGAMQLISELQRTIKPEFLGAKGVAGEMLVDRGLSQLAPEMANRERVDFRSGLVIARESLMREINNDPRFNQADRDEISKALPSNGIFESLPDAEQRLATVRRVLMQRGKIYAAGSGHAAPLWSLSKDEIVAQHNKFKSTGGKEGIDYNTALDALTRFH